MMNTETGARVILGIYDSPESPEHLTKLLGLTPTKVSTEDRGVWEFEHKSSNSDELGDLFNKLLTTLNSLTSEARAVLKDNRPQISLVTYYYGSNMGFDLSNEQLKTVVDFGCTLDIDFYCLGDE